MSNEQNKEPKAEKNTPKPRRKEEAGSVSVRLTDDLRAKLLRLNKRQQAAAYTELPLAASVCYAIEIAHETLFGEIAQAPSQPGVGSTEAP